MRLSRVRLREIVLTFPPLQSARMRRPLKRINIQLHACSRRGIALRGDARAIPRFFTRTYMRVSSDKLVSRIGEPNQRETESRVQSLHNLRRVDGLRVARNGPRGGNFRVSRDSHA
jgi:hypothetical protein